MPLLGRSLVGACALACMLGFAAPASASQLIARNATGIKLEVNGHGTALITYTAGGKLTHLLAWGAINARFRPVKNVVPQVKFKLDYSGGWGTYRRNVWKHFRTACRRYDGPKLAWFVTGCKAPDGSYWALQSWQTALPDLGFPPWLAMQKKWWLHLSHWSGPLAKLDVYSDWVYSVRWQELFGQYTYKGHPVRGFGTTRRGAPTDGYGRLVYLDTHNAPAYGPGWHRENSFVSSGPTGIFCYGFWPFDPYVGGYAHPRDTPHQKRGPGLGDRYRVTAEGFGVTPDVMWEGRGPHPYDPANPADVAHEREMNAMLDSIRAGWHKCVKH